MIAKIESESSQVAFNPRRRPTFRELVVVEDGETLAGILFGIRLVKKGTNPHGLSRRVGNFRVSEHCGPQFSEE